MASFERFEVVRVPFPFTDRQAEKNRPALIMTWTKTARFLDYFKYIFYTLHFPSPQWGEGEM